MPIDTASGAGLGPLMASDVMSRAVLAIHTETTIAQAIRLMQRHGVGGVPVLNARGRLAGILSEGDLLRRIEIETATATTNWFEAVLQPGAPTADFKGDLRGDFLGDFTGAQGRPVRNVMTRKVHAIKEDATLPQIAAMLRKHRIKRLPVLRGHRLVGIVSRSDLVAEVGHVVASRPASPSDTAIRLAILQEVAREAWGPTAMINVSVHDGVATLDGCLDDLRKYDALEILIENVAGVRRIVSNLVCTEPQTGPVSFDPTECGGVKAGMGPCLSESGWLLP